MRKANFITYCNVGNMVVCFSILLLFIIWGGLYFKVQNERHLEIENAVKETGNLAIALEENTVRTLRGLDEISIFLKIQYELEGKSIDIPRYIKEGRFTDQPFLLLSVADENGDMVASSQVPFDSINLSDREHFQVHKNGDIGLYISKPVRGKLIGKWAIQLSRRVNKPDGSFGGMAVVSVDPLYFAKFYQKVNLGQGSIITLLGCDGIVRVRQSDEKIDVGLDFSQRMHKELSGGGTGHYIDKSIVDGMIHIFSYRTLEDYPLIVAVAQNEQEVLKDVNKRIKDYFLLCGTMSVLIVLFCTFFLLGNRRRNRGEAMLQQLSSRLELATRAGRVGVWEYDVINDKLIWDEQICSLYGITQKDFSGIYAIWQAALHPDDVRRVDFEMQQALLGEKEFDTEFRICLPDGTTRNIRALASVQRDECGKPIKMIGTNWDITDNKRIENELIMAKDQAEIANNAKSQFLANMSHEIRTPMNGIIGLTDITLMTDLSDEQREYLTIVKTSTKALLRVLNDILDYSKIEAGKIELEALPFKLRYTMREVIELFSIASKEKGLQITLTIDKRIPEYIVGDSVRIRQVISNLIGNAIKFTNQGEVSITIEIAEKINHKIKLNFAITDTGIGITEDKLDKLFQRFSQIDDSNTKQFGGTGLGLAISKKLIEMMDGEIHVKSQKNIGSIFYFTAIFGLHAIEIDTIENIPSESLQEKRLTNKKILLAEDDAVSRNLATLILRKNGFQVIEVENGKHAIDAFEQERFDLILMDINMPQFDGYTVTEIIRGQEKDKNFRTPIIAMTAYALKGDPEKCLAAGMDAYISKPLDINKFIEIVNQWLIK